MLPMYFNALERTTVLGMLIGYLRMRNLCLIDGVEKAVGWSPLSWNRQSPVLYPSYNSQPFHLLSTHLTKILFGQQRTRTMHWHEAQPRYGFLSG